MENLAPQKYTVRKYSEEEINLIKNTLAVGATDSELRLFLTVCRNKQLDPFSNQVFFIKRADKGTIQTGIDGYRAIAERTGDYMGNDEPVFWPEPDPLLHAPLPPYKATVTVWKNVKGEKCGFTASALWGEYAPADLNDKSAFMWRRMPNLMLGKVAEALALRKAFPNDLSGIYTHEEMQQAQTVNANVKTDIKEQETITLNDSASNYELNLSCKKHFHTIRYHEAGISKTGKPYKGFYSCQIQEGGKYCKQPILNEEGQEVKLNATTGELEPVVPKESSGLFDNEPPPFVK